MNIEVKLQIWNDFADCFFTHRKKKWSIEKQPGDQIKFTLLS